MPDIGDSSVVGTFFKHLFCFPRLVEVMDLSYNYDLQSTLCFQLMGIEFYFVFPQVPYKEFIVIIFSYVDANYVVRKDCWTEFISLVVISRL